MGIPLLNLVMAPLAAIAMIWRKRSIKAFVAMALWGPVLAIISFLIILMPLQQMRNPGTAGAETKTSVVASIQKLLPQGVFSALDPTLQAVRQFRKERYVAAVWFVDENGGIIVHEDGLGQARDIVFQIGQCIVDALEGLPAQTIDSTQYLQLASLGAMGSEGEHNDVFRHLVHPLHRSDGSLGALVVIAYDLNPQVSNPGSAYMFFLLLGLAGLVIYWLALPVWVFLDARMRGESAGLWALFVLVNNLVGLIAYLLAIGNGRFSKQDS